MLNVFKSFTQTTNLYYAFSINLSCDKNEQIVTKIIM